MIVEVLLLMLGNFLVNLTGGSCVGLCSIYFDMVSFPDRDYSEQMNLRLQCRHPELFERFTYYRDSGSVWWWPSYCNGDCGSFMHWWYRHLALSKYLVFLLERSARAFVSRKFNSDKNVF